MLCSKIELYWYNMIHYNHQVIIKLFLNYQTSYKIELWSKIFMGFWIFMLVMDLIIPFTMLGIGRYFFKKTPKKINVVFGYRTTMSMKSKDTWEFAHKYCGRIWYVCGLVLLPLSIVLMFFLIGQSEDTIGTLGGVICAVQLIPFIGSVFPTEKALKKNFDNNGNRR